MADYLYKHMQHNTLSSCHWFDVAAAEADHSLHDCIAVGILSHGTHSSQVYGADGELMHVDVLLAPLKRCASLVGKPKMVFIEVRYLIMCSAVVSELVYNHRMFNNIDHMCAV